MREAASVRAHIGLAGQYAAVAWSVAIIAVFSMLSVWRYRRAVVR